VDRPEMPWSKRRQFDASYEAAMLEIDAAVAGLRARGATTVAIAGHSLGANAALGYAARRTGLYAVIALAPGHVPDGYMRRFGAEITHARELVAAGKGDAMGSFPHDNQGSVLEMRTTAEIYLSYCDPDGGAVMPRNVAAFTEAVPFLWVVGASDGMYKRGEQYAFAKAPPHPKSRYLVVQAGHRSTPDIAAEQVVEWLLGLKN
jgi:pimeloyl-ACP methyl ester carboxylesterase